MSASELECTHCGRTFTPHDGSGGVVRYYQCPGCYRWVSSCYADVLRSRANFRARAASYLRGRSSFGR